MASGLGELLRLPQSAQLIDLLAAFLLSALIGLEREWRQKSAGLRTTTLVGLSAALFMLISKYGFSDVLASGRVVLDPSRVAAQIVSGIGFIGGGVIFMRRDVVRGLTTAASVWVTAAIGMACGAGLIALAIATTLLHFVTVAGFPRLVHALPRDRRQASRLRISYQDGRGLLRTILLACSQLRFTITRVEIEREGTEDFADLADMEGGPTPSLPLGTRIVVLTLQVKGRRSVSELIARLTEIDGVTGAGLTADGEEPD